MKSASFLQIDNELNDIPPIQVNYPNFRFIIHKGDNSKEPLLNKDDINSKSRLRLGTIITPHGNIETPNFILCATKAAMKTVTPKQIRDEGSQVILSNTYHLMVTPGSEIIEKMGGLQKFTSWNGPMLTDSGGYQIFSMGHGSVSSEIKGLSLIFQLKYIKIDIIISI
jgi:queuine tRNA-ribosyltransferase